MCGLTTRWLNWLMCPTPEKKRYATASAAQFFAVTDGLRAYKCPCGSWHLTSKRVRRKKPVAK
jgi:hypothetical protein